LLRQLSSAIDHILICLNIDTIKWHGWVDEDSQIRMYLMKMHRADNWISTDSFVFLIFDKICNLNNSNSINNGNYKRNFKQELNCAATTLYII